MNARVGTGWQYVMTDLSMILFMITAAALRDAPNAAPPVHQTVVALGDPVALWRAAPGGPDLAHWAAALPRDPRQRLTLYAPLDGATAALGLARGAGRPVRLVLEGEGGGAPYAALTYDQGLAQSLQTGAHPSSQAELVR